MKLRQIYAALETSRESVNDSGAQYRLSAGNGDTDADGGDDQKRKQDPDSPTPSAEPATTGHDYDRRTRNVGRNWMQCAQT
jgi:hypothetical protein